MRRAQIVLVTQAVALAGCGALAALGDTKVLEDAGADASSRADATSGADAASSADATSNADATTTDGAAPTSEAATGDATTAAPIQAAEIAIARTHACVVVSGAFPGDPLDGTIRCWGSNATDALGVDPSTATSPRPLPVAPKGIDPAYAHVAVGDGFSCGTTSVPSSSQTGGYVYCWGAIPGTDPGGVHPARTDLPAYVPNEMLLGATPFVDVASASLGYTGGCFAGGGLVFCWGGPYAAATSPDAGVVASEAGVAIKVNADQIVVGRAHACAVLRGGVDVNCWGQNDYSQTGLPVASNPGIVPQPSRVGLPAGAGAVLTIAAGDDHTCALMASGEIYCWGRNDRGQLGGGGVSHDSATPILVVLGGGAPKSGIQRLALGDGYTCALDSTQRVMCWGDNSADQLGRDSGGAPSPTPGPALEGASSVAAGGRTTCATRFGDTAIWCWGANDAQQAGQATGATVPLAAPVQW